MNTIYWLNQSLALHPDFHYKLQELFKGTPWELSAVQLLFLMIMETGKVRRSYESH